MSAHFVGSRPFANLLQVSISDVPPSFNVVGCCPGPMHRILAALVRPVTWEKQWCCMGIRDDDEQVGTYIMVVGTAWTTNSTSK